MKARKALSVLSAFLIASIVVFSGAASAQTATFNGNTYTSLTDAVAAVNAAGRTGTITLSAGRFEISKALYLDGMINIVGAALDTNGEPTSIITFDDSQSFELATDQGSGKYLVVVSNVNTTDTVVNFTNVKLIAGTPTNGCTIGGGAAAACILGGFDYVIGDASGTVTGTITNGIAINGTVALIVHNGAAPAGACSVTLDDFVMGDNSWGGVNIQNGGELIIGSRGIIVALAVTTPDAQSVYVDAGTPSATVTLPDGSTTTVVGGTPLSTLVVSFDSNNGSFFGGFLQEKIYQLLSTEPPPR
ncbi:MAG: hypothetical protein LBB65_05865 [Burkholderiales bacterium]|jgi:hypothetical protein|nr:hypothetical protein [Burkholderiales bacterium]